MSTIRHLPFVTTACPTARPPPIVLSPPPPTSGEPTTQNPTLKIRSCDSFNLNLSPLCNLTSPRWWKLQVPYFCQLGPSPGLGSPSSPGLQWGSAFLHQVTIIQNITESRNRTERLDPMRKRYSTSERKEQELLTARKKVNLKMLSELCWMFTCVPCSRSLILLTMLLKKTLLCLTSILELQQHKVFQNITHENWLIARVREVRKNDMGGLHLQSRWVLWPLSWLQHCLFCWDHLLV